MSLGLLPPKRPDDIVPVTFNFLGDMIVGETITGQVVTCDVFSGTDPDPSLMISGTPSLSGAVITQLITGGLEGVIYILTGVVTTSEGNRFSKTAKLAVVSQNSAFSPGT